MRLLIFALAALPLLAQHPRIWLDSATLTELRAKAASSRQSWIKLKAQCDATIPGVVYPPKSVLGRYDFTAPGSDYGRANSTNPDIGLGYQGTAGTNRNGYFEAMLNIAMCYQMTISGPAQNTTAAANYAAKGRDILTMLALKPGVIDVTTGLKSGQKRYVYDSTFASGTAWAGESVVVDGAIAQGAAAIPMRGFTPNGSVLAGDGFVINGKIYLVRANTTASATGRASVMLGSIHSGAGAVNSSATVASGLADGTAVGTPIVLQSNQHNLKTGDEVVVSGVGGNTGANGSWTITALDNFHILLNGSSGVGGQVQTQLPFDALVNQGFGARFFATAMGIGYDWLYDELPPQLRADIREAIVRWIQETERNGYGQKHVAGNYYAGQSVAKLYGALAIEPEDSRGATLYSEWYNNEWIATARRYRSTDNVISCASGDTCLGIQPYFNNYLTDTAHPDGGNYGWLATQNYLWIALAVKSAKGIDLTASPSPGWSWPEGAAKAIVHQTWPDRQTFNTRQKLFDGVNPSRVSGDAIFTVSYALRKFGFSFAPYFQSYANEVKAVLDGVSSIEKRYAYQGRFFWNTFMCFDESAAAIDYKTLPLSFYSAGSGEFEARSDWTKSAVWSSYIAGPNVHSVEGNKDVRDRGSLTISRGLQGGSTSQGVPFIVDATVELYKIQQVSYADSHSVSETTPPISNTFSVNSGQRWRQSDYGPGNYVTCLKSNNSAMSRHTDGGTYTAARGTNLQDNYYPVGYFTGFPGQSSACGGTKPFASWTRDTLFIRPRLFFVYDRVKGVGSDQWDRYMAWHFAKTPVSVTGPAGISRYDVSNGSLFRGAAFGIKPDSHATTRVDVGGFGQVYRVEYRQPGNTADSNWFFAFDASAAANSVYTLTKRSGDKADAVQAAEINTVVAFAQDDIAVLPLSYSYDATNATQHFVSGLIPNRTYGLLTNATTVTITEGSSAQADSAGVLTFGVEAGGGGTTSPVALAVSPALLNFTCVQGQFNPVPQNIALTATGGAASISPAVNAPWLSATLSGGTAPQDTPQTITVTVDCNGLATGQFAAQVAVSTGTQGVLNNPLIVPVQLQVTSSAGILGVNVSSLEFSGTPQAPPLTENVEVTRSPAGGVEISSGAPWLTASPNSAVNTASLTVAVGANTQTLAPGSYNTTLTFTPTDAPAQAVAIPVSLTVTPDESNLHLTVHPTSSAALVKYRAPDAAQCRLDLCIEQDCQGVIQQTYDGGGIARRTVVLNGLSPQTQYFPRAVCSEATQTGQLTTLTAQTPVQRSLTVGSAPPPNVPATHLSVEYGLNPESLAPIPPVACSSGCRVQVPVLSDSIYYIRTKWLGVAQNTLATGTLRTHLVE